MIEGKMMDAINEESKEEEKLYLNPID